MESKTTNLTPSTIDLTLIIVILQLEVLYFLSPSIQPPQTPPSLASPSPIKSISICLNTSLSKFVIKNSFLLIQLICRQLHQLQYFITIIFLYYFLSPKYYYNYITSFFLNFKSLHSHQFTTSKTQFIQTQPHHIH